jgi:hypothetical protein
VVHEELTEKILNARFEVSNELGSGFLESVYDSSGPFESDVSAEKRR